jgi:hypothetical protein
MTAPPSAELPALLLPLEAAFAAPSALLLVLKNPNIEESAPAMEDVRATLPPAAGASEALDLHEINEREVFLSVTFPHGAESIRI